MDLIWYLLGLIIFIGGVLFFGRNVGRWIIKYDEPQKANILFIFMGNLGDRSLHALRLYKSGFASKIVLINPIDKQNLLLAKQNIVLPSRVEMMKLIFSQKSIDCSAIEVIEGPSLNTMEEAKELVLYCENNPSIERVLIVTSSYHSGRANKILKHEFRRNKVRVKLLFPFNSYTDYDPKNWFLTESGIQITISELIKTIRYLGWKRFLN